MKLIMESWTKFLKEAGFNDPMNPRDPLYSPGHDKSVPMNKPDSPGDLEKKYTHSKPSHQAEGRKIAAEEIQNLIAKMERMGYHEAKDPLYNAFLELTRGEQSPV